MKRLDIGNLLNGVLSPEAFSAVYAGEVLSHVTSLGKKGASASIVLVGDEYIFFSKSNLERLVRYIRAGDLSKEVGEYLLDALCLDSKVRFSGDDLREALFELADTEIE